RAAAGRFFQDRVEGLLGVGIERARNVPGIAGEPRPMLAHPPLLLAGSHYVGPVRARARSVCGAFPFAQVPAAAIPCRRDPSSRREERGMAHPNAEVARRATEALSRRDIEGFLSLHADDVVVHFPGRGPMAGDYRGKD